MGNGPVTNEILLERLTEIAGDVADIRSCLNGTGSADNPGLKVRVDRLEQAEMGIVGLAANAVVSLIRGAP